MSARERRLQEQRREEWGKNEEMVRKHAAKCSEWQVGRQKGILGWQKEAGEGQWMPTLNLYPYYYYYYTQLLNRSLFFFFFFFFNFKYEINTIDLKRPFYKSGKGMWSLEFICLNDPLGSSSGLYQFSFMGDVNGCEEGRV